MRNSYRNGFSATNCQCGFSSKSTSTSGAPMSAASSKAVVLLSGGLDSYTAAAIARELGFELYALTIKYGQRHGHEILAARKVAEALGAQAHRELAVDLAPLGGSALLGDGGVPKGG